MTFAERVVIETRQPDAVMREAMREVDRLTPAVPPIAPAEPPPPTLVGGNSVWRAPPPVVSMPPETVVSEETECYVRDAYLAIKQRPWFWPYVQADLGAEMFVLHERFGGARVSREWLELHRHDIVQAMREL